MRGITHQASQAVVNAVIAKSEAGLQYILNNYTLPARWTVISSGGFFKVIGDDGDGGGGFITPEYQAILNYATGQGYTLPSQAIQDKGNVLVAALLDDGIWDNLDVFYAFNTDGDADFALINWKSPGAFIPTTGDLVKTVDGFLAGAASVFSIDFTPSINGVAYQADNAGVVFEILNGDTGLGSDMANQDGTHYSLVQLGVGAVDTFGLNTANYSTSPSDANTNGVYLIARLTGLMKLFKNGNSLSSQSNPGNGLSIVSPVTFMNSRGGASYGFMGLSSSLDGKELALSNAWAAYKV